MDSERPASNAEEGLVVDGLFRINRDQQVQLHECLGGQDACDDKKQEGPVPENDAVILHLGPKEAVPFIIFSCDSCILRNRFARPFRQNQCEQDADNARDQEEL
ncbi:Uncharacterised protein [Mycobacteroides abscessus subsp. abscessus]|nr:Uncharacterised protein [Mycobacteroides abscessus subsp. abscessus]